MSKLTDKIQELIPDGDGYNSDYADTLSEAIDELNRMELLVGAYEYIGKRISAQNGNWLMLHCGTTEWLVNQFKILKDPKTPENSDHIEQLDILHHVETVYKEACVMPTVNGYTYQEGYIDGINIMYKELKKVYD